MAEIHPLDQALVDAAFEIHRRQWRRRFPLDAYVVLDVPDEPHPLYAVLALDATTSGVNVARGPDAPAVLQRIAATPDGAFAEDALDLIGFAMEPLAKLPPEARDLLRRAGRDATSDGDRPWFLCKRLGRRGRPLNRDERRTMLYVLKALLRADDEHRLNPAPIREGATPVRLGVTGDPIAPQVAYGHVKLLIAGALPPGAVVAPPADVRLARLPKLRRRYAVSFERGPVVEDGDEKIVFALIVMDLDADRLITFESGEHVTEATERFWRTFLGENQASAAGLPREILFTSEDFYRAMKAPLEAAGTRCRWEPSIPALERALKAFVAECGEDPAALDAEDLDPDDEEEFDIGRLPAPDDLAAWKSADRDVSHLISEDVASSGLLNRAALKSFFGETSPKGYTDGSPEAAQGLAMALGEWIFVHRRPSKDGETLLEQALAQNPPPAHRALLISRRDAPMGVYIVDAVLPGVSVTLRDVAKGKSRTVRDVTLSRSAMPGAMFAAKIHAAGAFDFLTIFSPSFGSLDSDEVMRTLRSAGAGIGLERLADKPHLVGRLWTLADELATHHRPMPRMTNMDGDPLLRHVAHYESSDPAATHAALRKRPDLHHDAARDEFDCIRQEVKGAKPISNTIVAHLQCIGSELIVKTNSVRRHEAARAWIEGLPGVRFRTVRTESIEERRNAPLDDRLTDAARENEPLAPEHAAELQAAIDAHAATWPDVPLPALAGKTPRQALKTAAGRAKVRILINTMPDPLGLRPGTPIKFPREKLLRDLGLAGDS